MLLSPDWWTYLKINIARSSNGRTPPSGGGYLGSNPGLAAITSHARDVYTWI